jgi:hypothetical protein
MSIHVLINGDRSFFKSKTAIDRFKKDLKKSTVHLNSSKYLKENYDYKLTIEDDKYIVDLVKKESRDELKAKLKTRLKGLNKYRKNTTAKEMKEMKKKIPKNIFNSFVKLKQKMPDVPFDRPEDILSNPDKYKERFKDLASSLNESDATSSDPFRSYIYKMTKELGLEDHIGSHKIENMINKRQEELEKPTGLDLQILEDMTNPDCESNEFVKAESFEGAKEGMVYKKGTFGLGYYPDKKKDEVINIEI